MYSLYGIRIPVTVFNASLTSIALQWSVLDSVRAKYWHERAVFVKQSAANPVANDQRAHLHIGAVF